MTPPPLSEADRVADAMPENWVDRFAPARSRPYLRLARADRPIGTWLLLLPCWWSTALAAGRGAKGDFGAGWFGSHGLPDPLLLILFAVGAFVMRGAGCTYNDIVDRDYDAQVARTRSRPLPSGAVTLKAAWAFLALQALAGLLVLLSFNTFAILLGISSLAIVAIYPFMKRVTYWPQVVLGLAFNWGALMGWAAVTGSLALAPVLLYFAAVFWTIGYDTIYAHQDKDDDALIGLKSTALRFGKATRGWLMLFYGLTAALLVCAGLAADLGLLYFGALAFPVAHLARQILLLDIDDPALCLRLFKSNRDFGLMLFGAIILGVLAG